MPPPDPEISLLADIYSWLALFCLIGLVFLVWRLGWAGQRLLPVRRDRAVPWSFLEVVMAALAAIVFWPFAISGIVQALYGICAGVDVFAHSSATGAGPGGAVPRSVEPLLNYTTLTVCVPLSLISIPLLMRVLSGTRAYQLGLTLWRWWPNVVVGCLGWLILTPTAYAVELITNQLQFWLTGQEPGEHPMVQTLGENPSVTVWGLIAFLSLIGAPLVEELLFRGVLQRWLCRDGRRANFAVLAAVAVTALAGIVKADLGWMVFAALILLADVFFPDLARPWFRQRHVARGVYATAVLFGLSHYAIWPTPVPLTVLGLGLGWLAYRTQSLVPSMVTHGLFNGVTMLSLVFLARLTA